MIELKPCPFCGSEPELIKLDTQNYYVSCKRQYCVEQKHVYMTKKSAVIAWNRRAEWRE